MLVTRRRMLATLGAPLVAGCRGLDIAGPLFNSVSTDPVTLIGAGDPHASCRCNAHIVGRIIKDLLDQNPGAYAFALGDLVPNGTASEFLIYNDAWGSFKDRTLFMMGNHDRKADPTGAAYYKYVGTLGGERGKGYYAKTLGAWRCYFLNSEMVRREQWAWLANDLPQWSPTHHIMAMWHTPMFASLCQMSPTKSMAWPGNMGMGPFWQAMQDHGAEFVVSGHVHRWERFKPMLRNGTVSEQGVRQFIAGTGGVKPMNPFSKHQHCESQVTTRGVVRFDLYADRYEWRVTDLTGTVRDSGSQMCRKLLDTI